MATMLIIAFNIGYKKKLLVDRLRKSGGQKIDLISLLLNKFS